jgi:hypothetical protein
MEMWKMDLDKLSRGDLQTLAKAHGIKANKKSTEIIAELRALGARKSESNKPSEPSVEVVCSSPASATEGSAYESMSRTTLQALAKERGFKANAKTADLVKTLQDSDMSMAQLQQDADNGQFESKDMGPCPPYSGWHKSRDPYATGKFYFCNTITETAGDGAVATATPSAAEGKTAAAVSKSKATQVAISVRKEYTFLFPWEKGQTKTGVICDTSKLRTNGYGFIEPDDGKLCLQYTLI